MSEELVCPWCGKTVNDGREWTGPMVHTCGAIITAAITAAEYKAKETKNED